MITNIELIASDQVCAYPAIERMWYGTDEYEIEVPIDDVETRRRRLQSAEEIQAQIDALKEQLAQAKNEEFVKYDTDSNGQLDANEVQKMLDDNETAEQEDA